MGYEKINIIKSTTVPLSIENVDTDQIIPWPMRVSAFVAVCVPVMAGLTLSAPTPINSLFW